MSDSIEKHLEAALSHYSQEQYYDIMLKAKTRYLELAGTVDDSSEQEYENKMNCFNDWYLLQYSLPDKQCTVMEDYLQSLSLDEDILEAFKSFYHSIFQYLGKGFKGNFSIKDLWSKKKFTLNRDTTLPLMKNDIFIGRMIPWREEAYLLKGHSHLPADSWSLIKKQMRKVMKTHGEEGKTDFLLQLESLNTKYSRYGHVDAAKIFIFDRAD